MSDKVSVIIPIYKVESYLPRCIDSVAGQTYSNLEILLVDDGSPDNCGKIADEYAKYDHRIQVLHKQNGGLSDARNYGMSRVTGEYTMFVDSDDWLDKRIIEKSVNRITEHEADIVQCEFYYSYDDYLLYDNRYDSEVNFPVIRNRDALMRELLAGKRVKNFAWGKLYKTELIKDIPFETGVLFEDVFWTYKVFHQVNKYTFLRQPLYFYYQRDDSIVASYTAKNLDILKGLEERHRFIEQYYPDLVCDSYRGMLKENIIHYNLLTLHRSKDQQGKCRKNIHRFIKSHGPELRTAAAKDKQLRLQLFLFSVHPYCNVCYLAFWKLLRKLKLFPRPAGLKQINL